MGMRKKNNQIKSQNRVATLKRVAAKRIKREKKGKTIGQKLAEKMDAK